MIKALAEILYDDELRVSYLDMSNFTEPESIWELLGYNDKSKGEIYPSLLTSKIHHYPHSILFLEEIDKADHEVRDLFSDIFRMGTFTDSQGNIMSFKGITVVMTVKAYEDKKKQLGFVPGSGSDFDREAVHDAMAGILKREMMETIDSIVIFNELKKNEIGEIVKMNLMTTLRSKMNIEWTVDTSVIDFLVFEIQNSDEKLRSMQRLFQDHVFSFLARKYYSEDIKKKKRIHLNYSQGNMELS